MDLEKGKVAIVYRDGLLKNISEVRNRSIEVRPKPGRGHVRMSFRRLREVRDDDILMESKLVHWYNEEEYPDAVIIDTSKWSSYVNKQLLAESATESIQLLLGI